MLLEIKDNETTTDYFDYYLRNKKFIYLAIFETFKGFTSKNNLDNLRLTIKVLAQNEKILITHYDFSFNDKYILNDLLMPYFIKENEFEICEKIKITSKKLSRINR